MSLPPWQPIGVYRGIVHPAAADLRPALLRIDSLLTAAGSRVLQAGRHTTTCLRLGTAGPWVAVKSFGRQDAIKDGLDRRRGSKAFRTFTAATYLAEHRVATPEALACLERWDGPRLGASHFVSRFLPDVASFKGELIRLFRDEPECSRFMDLLGAVAAAVRRMHDAGFLHRDLGNQNILLGPPAAGRAVYFLDLNRGRSGRPLTDAERGRDLSRISLPSDFRRVFLEMYWQDVAPDAFRRSESIHRTFFAVHTATRRWRHPIREYRRAKAGVADAEYPPPRDQWVWDSRSGQPVPTLRPRDRHRYYPPLRPFQLAGAVVPALPAIWQAWRRLAPQAFSRPVNLERAFAVAVDGDPAHFRRETDLLAELGIRDVFVRLYHHDAEAMRTSRLQALAHLTEAGYRVAGGLVQDRRAVLDPASWAAFCHQMLAPLGWHTEWVEFGHCINRVKWGVWGFEDYRRLIAPLPAIRQAHPGVHLVGPATIDFEFEFAVAALAQLPPGCAWDALSTHLYVDRRGAPESRQGRFDAVAKFALAAAVAAASGGRCGERVIVSEMNWPLAGTGVHSPVGAPHVSPGPRHGDPSVDEPSYARYLLRYLLLAACSGHVQQTVVWRLAAHGYGLIDDHDPSGQWRRRPAFAALGFLRRTLGSGRFVRRVPLPGQDDRLAYLLACEDASGRAVLVGWAHESVGAIEVEAPFRVAECRDMTGQRMTLGSDRRLRLTPEPLYAFG